MVGLVIADLLHRRDPAGSEGPKTKARARLVSSAFLARRAAALGLPALLRLGRGEEKTGGRTKHALWADAYEAVVAALYLDGGIAAAQAFVAADLGPALETAPAASDDPKSQLQEVLQGRGLPPPRYELLAEEGPSHQPVFRVACHVGEDVTEGRGSSKKAAQKEAARLALAALRGEDPAAP